MKDIQLYNNADTSSLTFESTQMIIKSDGNITWLATGIFDSSCSIDVHYFPFDTQVRNSYIE